MELGGLRENAGRDDGAGMENSLSGVEWPGYKIP